MSKSQHQDTILRKKDEGIRVMLNTFPFGTFDLTLEELESLIHQTQRCVRCGHLLFFHPYKGGYCLIGRCQCTEI